MTHMLRLLTALAATALALTAAAAPAPAHQTVSGLEFTDWTSAGGTVARGTLFGRPVTLSGWQMSDVPAVLLDGSSNLWSGPYFTPSLPHADAVELRSEFGTPHAYTLDLGGPVTDPVLHLGSLGTTLEFPAGTSITRLSGRDAGFAAPATSSAVRATRRSTSTASTTPTGRSASTAPSRRSPSPPRRRTRSTGCTCRSAPCRPWRRRRAPRRRLRRHRRLPPRPRLPRLPRPRPPTSS